MKPIKTKTTNCILKGHGVGVEDLPVTKINYTDGIKAVESCWKMNFKERLAALLTGRIYFVCLGETHPPIYLAAKSELK